jgi:hypothetical protein
MSLPTLSELIADLQLAKELAIQSGNANSLVTATIAQAKLLGIDKPQPKPNDDVRLISELMDELSNEQSKPKIIELVPATRENI